MASTLEIDLLRTFVAFADSGSLTRAAALVHRTQSAVSMQMKRLQEAVDQPLFTRVGRDLELTEDGQRLLGYARRLLALHEEAVGSLRGDTLAGELRIGVLEDYAASYLPGLFSGFAESYPNLRLEVRCETSPALQAALERSEIDLAILAVDRVGKRDVLLAKEPMAWVTSPRHAAHERRPLPLAVFRRDGPRQSAQALDGALDAEGHPFTYRTACVSESKSATHAAVAAGMAVAAVARSTADPSFRILTEADGFPPLPDLTVVIRRPPGPTSAAGAKIADVIRTRLGAAAA